MIECKMGAWRMPLCAKLKLGSKIHRFTTGLYWLFGLQLKTLFLFQKRETR